MMVEGLILDYQDSPFLVHFHKEVCVIKKAA